MGFDDTLVEFIHVRQFLYLFASDINSEWKEEKK